jgi:gliding motility-associated protein GldL
MSLISSIEKVTEAKWYKVMMPKLYGWGASLVIIGALFKIEHWPYSSEFLIAGLGIEAVIFFFSAFEKNPEPDPDWSLVYPELAHMQDPDAAKRPAQQLDDALARAKIDNELIESLNEGLKSFGESAKQLNETVAAASGTSEYNDQIQEGVKNMNALNSLYELQLQASNQQMEATTMFLQNLQASVDDSKKFQEQVSSLADNLEQLNKVYGNMLIAMNPNKEDR